ncbi:hypothetical protein GCM10020256_08560 [Streptomyces thermocoprophilus]
MRTGDSLRADAFPDLTVDAVLCNPPYGDRDWGHDELAYDARWAYGFPPRAESELAWVQHALAHLEPGGHAVLLLPPATASRSSGRRIRSELIRSGALRAVASLPPGAAIPLHVGLQVWVLQRPDPMRPAPGRSCSSTRPPNRRHRHRDAARAAPGRWTGRGSRSRSCPRGRRTPRTRRASRRGPVWRGRSAWSTCSTTWWT